MLSHTECSRALAHLRHATLLYVLLHLHTYGMIRACTNVQINFQTVLGLHVLLERKVPHHVPGDLDVAAAADDGGGGDDVMMLMLMLMLMNMLVIMSMLI